MNIIFISEVSRSKRRLEPNEIVNDILVKTANIRARPTITSLHVFIIYLVFVCQFFFISKVSKSLDFILYLYLHVIFKINFFFTFSF